MNLLLSIGLFSWLIIVWAIISTVLIAVLFKRLSKHILLIAGTLLGGILFALGATGLFSGLTYALRSLATSAPIDVESILLESTRVAHVPFSVGTVLTIIYFAIIIVVLLAKKGTLKKWSLWIGFIIFFVFTFLSSYYRHSMNVQLLKGFAKMVGLTDTIPEQMYPLIRASRTVVITALFLSIAYFLIAILITLRRGKQKKAPLEKKPLDSEVSTQKEVNNDTK